MFGRGDAPNATRRRHRMGLAKERPTTTAYAAGPSQPQATPQAPSPWMAAATTLMPTMQAQVKSPPQTQASSQGQSHTRSQDQPQVFACSKAPPRGHGAMRYKTGSHQLVFFKISIITLESRGRMKKTIFDVLDKQKFRAGALSVRCHFDDVENEQEKLAGTTVEDLVKSEGYSPFSIDPRAEHDIVENLEDVVSQLGQTLAGSIICFSEAKFLITSLDAFVHIKDVDDCFFSNKWLDITPFAKLHNKFEKGRSLFEVSVIVHGCIELLAIGGLISITNKPVDAFLGSSVKPLKDGLVVDGDRLTKQIYTLKRPQQQLIIRTERLLRQNYKDDSCKQWSFHLGSAHAEGFYPVNPMNVSSHPSVNSIELNLQSYIVCSMARRHVERTSLQVLLDAVTNSRDHAKKLKLVDFNGESFAAIFEAMRDDGKWRDMIKVVKLLEAGEISFEETKEATVANKKIVLARCYINCLNRVLHCWSRTIPGFLG